MWIVHGSGTRGNLGRRFVALSLLLCAACAVPALAADLVLKDGRTLTGKVSAPIASLVIEKSTVPSSNPAPRSIQMVDDDLRWVFVPRSSLSEVNQPPALTVKQTFRLSQRTMINGPAIKSVGPLVEQPFDDWGRRTVSMFTNKGQVDVIQGITVLTPEWCKVEGITHVWDMRMATTAIPRDTLARMLRKQIKNPKRLDDRLKIVRFYIQGERYEEAQAELQAILTDFPGEAVREQLKEPVATLQRMKAERWLSELRLLKAAGQYGLVVQFLEKFPTDNVPGEVLEAVREMLNEFKVLEARRTTVLDTFGEVLAKIGDAKTRAGIAPLYDEMKAELSINTLDRFAPFLQNMDVAGVSPDDKVALAVSGWLMGPDAAVAKLSMALSAYRLRETIRAYINDPTQLSRAQRLGRMNSEEAAGLPNVAAIVAHMKPPLDTPVQDQKRPDFFELQIPGPEGQAAVPYLVQLPPNYDPYRRYPAIVTLHGEGMTAEQQLDWWAGSPRSDGARRGQAGRHGYIVIAPAWGLDHQKEYDYSAREMNAVLGCLRDACCRFAVDTDRVFLSGHSMGGDAAWDLGLAHPDLWAGVIPIVARGQKYTVRYWENAKMVPTYFVCGELDGLKMQENAVSFDRYLQYRYPTTVVEYQGRGHEPFSDEILHLFDWMGRYHRDFYPREFSCSTMRSFDNFFWWLEVTRLSAGGLVDPSDWPPRPNLQPVKVGSSRNAINGLSAHSGGTGLLNIWVSPQLFDLSRPITITVNGQSVNPKGAALPNLRVLLEDVRTRGDRQHPFWAKIEMPIGRAAR